MPRHPKLGTAERRAAYNCTASPTLNNGYVASITNNRDTTRGQTFTHGALNRIKTAATQATSGSNAWGLQFGYDIWANLLSSSVTQGSAPMLSVGVNLKNQVTNTGFSYDAAGNVMADGLNSYTFDAENRMKSSNVAGNLVNYTYDADGKRVQKSSGKLYWYGAGSDPLDETDAAGNTNISGGNAENYDFYPFGESSSSGATTRHKFTGKERDAESGLDYFGARYYTSRYGRWLSPDWSAAPSPVPYGDFIDPQTLNLYGYVRNNAPSHGDADGHCCDWQDVKDFANGLANAVKSNFALGAGREEQPSSAGKLGETAGDAVSTIMGAVEMVVGGGVATGGLVLDSSGVGAVAGVPANVAGAGLALHGAGMAASGAIHLAENTSGKTGEVYITDPQESGKPYVGRTTQGTEQRMETRTDGRTGKARVVDRYNPKNKTEGRYKEQKQIDRRGGVKNLDNKRNGVLRKR